LAIAIIAIHVCDQWPLVKLRFRGLGIVDRIRVRPPMPVVIAVIITPSRNVHPHRTVPMEIVESDVSKPTYEAIVPALSTPIRPHGCVLHFVIITDPIAARPQPSRPDA